MTSETRRDTKRELELWKLSGVLADEAMAFAKRPTPTDVRRDWVARAMQTHRDMVNFIAFQPSSPSDEAMMTATNEFKKLIDMLRVKWEL